VVLADIVIKVTGWQDMEQWYRFMGMGFYIAGCIVGAILLGLWLDRKFGTAPVLLLVFLVLGLIVAFWGVYQTLLPIIKGNNNKKPRR